MPSCFRFLMYEKWYSSPKLNPFTPAMLSCWSRAKGSRRTCMRMHCIIQKQTRTWKTIVPVCLPFETGYFSKRFSRHRSSSNFRGYTVAKYLHSTTDLSFKYTANPIYRIVIRFDVIFPFLYLSSVWIICLIRWYTRWLYCELTIIFTDSYKGQIAPNIKIVSWLPQNDVLGHPKTRLFYTHAGTNGLAESAYHGVPMVCSPFFGDQFDNSQRVKDHGVGEIMPVRTATTEQILEVLKKVLDDSRYCHPREPLVSFWQK